ncbi:MAG: RDD family protein [Halobacteriota archaeon]
MRRRYEEIQASSALQNLWIRRVIAYVIDSVILLIVLAIVNAFLALILLVPSLIFSFDVFGGVFSGFSALLGLVIIWGYYTLSEGSMSATVGKRIMGLRVRPLRGRMSYTKAFIRNFTKAWIPIIVLLFLLDLVIGLVTEGDPRQRFSDVAADTSVIVW